MLYMNHSSGKRQASANSTALKLCFCLFSAVFIFAPFLPFQGVKADLSNNYGFIIQDVKVIDTDITYASRNYNTTIKHLNVTYTYDESSRFRIDCKNITAYAYKLYVPKTVIEPVTANCLGNTICVENVTDKNLYTIRLKALFSNNKTIWTNQKKVDLNSKKSQCNCGAYGSKDEECPPVARGCTCYDGYDGPDCNECSIGFYRPFGLKEYECLPCDDCRQSHCAWQLASLEPKSYLCINSTNYSQLPRLLIGSTTIASNSMHNNGSINNNNNDGDASALSQIALTMLIIIALILLLLIAIVLYRRHAVRARRRERQSLAAQRLFSRFKDDSMLDNDASSILKIDDNQLQPESATLRLGSDSVYQPTTMSVA